MTRFKTGTFGQPELFDPKLTRHFLQYAQNTRRPTCTGVENRRIEIFTNIRNGQKDELGTRCPELVLLTVPNICEYFYTKIRFSTPALSALLPLAGQIYLT